MRLSNETKYVWFGLLLVLVTLLSGTKQKIEEGSSVNDSAYTTNQI